MSVAHTQTSALARRAIGANVAFRTPTLRSNAFPSESLILSRLPLKLFKQILPKNIFFLSVFSEHFKIESWALINKLRRGVGHSIVCSASEKDDGEYRCWAIVVRVSRSIISRGYRSFNWRARYLHWKSIWWIPWLIHADQRFRYMKNVVRPIQCTISNRGLFANA